MPCGHSKLEEYGWEMQEPYFNAGMMLLSLQVSHATQPTTSIYLALYDRLQMQNHIHLSILCHSMEAEVWFP